MKRNLICLTLLGAALLAVPASAHHSAAAYDRTNLITLTGEITEYHWVNPHTWVYLRVTTEDGATQEWALEG